MVTGGTVDEDIYKIQESKMKMNDAIMEKDKKQNKSENAEMSRLANAAVERFLKSPSRPSSESS
jgi:SNF2 family DNA or RNA helicase